MMPYAIHARDVRKTFGKGELAFEALKGVDFCVKPGEFVILRGPSGSGKTTLLSVLGCVLNATFGEVSLLGERVDGLDERRLAQVRREKIGFVFQSGNLIAALSAVNNVALGLQLKGVPRRRACEVAAECLTQVGLGDKLRHRASQLSGGQQQRVAVARALAGHPPLLLADEPTASLDAASGQEVMRLMRDLTASGDRSVVVVTHDDRILHFADRIVDIEDGCMVSNEQQREANASDHAPT
ncbi:MAG: ABC transporter ATP-binding protein [Polyangiales bacterium]